LAEVVRIRVATEGDAAAIAAIYRPVVENTAISFETVAPDSDEIARRLNDTLPSYPWIVCEIDDHIVGYAYATRHRVRGAYRWSVDTSVYVSDGCRRRGVGSGLYASLFAMLTAQGFVNAYAGIALPNPGSVGLHESMGFEKIGVYRRVGYKLGRWHDVGWWQLGLREHEQSPREPLDVTTLSTLPDWERLLSLGVTRIRADAA
jgi:phosphinothricin acetyltransferase